MFSALGVPVYIADVEAKALTNRSKVIRRKLIALLGEEAYSEEGLNKHYVANLIFKDSQLLAQVNAIIHPKVAQHFKRWVKKQEGPYVIKEVAILFEHGGEKDCDAVLLVTAPKKLRVERVLMRDKTTAIDLANRMKHQWSDERKLPLADFHIENIEMEATKAAVKEIHNTLSQ